MKKLLVPVIIVGVAFSSCSKKNPQELAQKEFELSQKSSVNIEIKEMEKALQKAKTDVEKANIYTNIAYIHNKKGDIKNMMDAARKAIKFQPNQYMSHYLLGKSYIASGRFSDALSELEYSIRLKTDFAPAYFEAGNACYKQYKYKNASIFYKKAIKYDDEMCDAYNNHGVISIIIGKNKEAENNFKNAISIDPLYAKAYKNLGILYDTKIGNKNKATINYKKYLDLRPNCPERNLVKLWITSLEE